MSCGSASVASRGFRSAADIERRQRRHVDELACPWRRSGTICTGRSSPTSIGPITVAPPSSCSSLVEIEAEWNAGMISTLAGPVSRQNG